MLNTKLVIHKSMNTKTSKNCQSLDIPHSTASAWASSQAGSARVAASSAADISADIVHQRLCYKFHKSLWLMSICSAFPSRRRFKSSHWTLFCNLQHIAVLAQEIMMYASIPYLYHLSLPLALTSWIVEAHSLLKKVRWAAHLRTWAREWLQSLTHALCLNLVQVIRAITFLLLCSVNSNSNGRSLTAKLTSWIDFHVQRRVQIHHL